MVLMEKIEVDYATSLMSKFAEALVGQAVSSVATDRQGKLQDEPISRVTVHVVSHNEGERAQMARLIFSLGHHAEVYNDAAEIAEHAPVNGVILVRETEQRDCICVLEHMDSAGRWLPIIGFGDQLSTGIIVQGVKAGVLDYIVGSCSPSIVNEKIRACYLEGEKIISARRRQTNARQKVRNLSCREGEVLGFLANGCSNKEIARFLEISPRTVEIHRMKMMVKLGAKHSADAIRIQLEAGGIHD